MEGRLNEVALDLHCSDLHWGWHQEQKPVNSPGLLFELHARLSDTSRDCVSCRDLARSKGATEAEIEAARRCLKDAPAQTAQVDHWTTQ